MERIRIDRTRQPKRHSAPAATVAGLPGKSSFKHSPNQSDGYVSASPVDASRHSKETKQRAVGFTSELLSEFTPPDVRSRRVTGPAPNEKAQPHPPSVRVNPLTARMEGAKSAEKEEVRRPSKSALSSGAMRMRSSSSSYGKRSRTRSNVEPSEHRSAWMCCAQAADLLTTGNDAWKLAVQAMSHVQSVEELLTHSYGNSSAPSGVESPTPQPPPLEGVPSSTIVDASSSSSHPFSYAPTPHSARTLESSSQGLPTLAGGGGVGLGRDLCSVLALHVDVALRLEAAHALADHRARLNQHLNASSAATWNSARHSSSSGSGSKSSGSSSSHKKSSSRLEAAAAAALLPLAAEANLLVASARSLVLPLLLVSFPSLSQPPAEESTSGDASDSWSVAIGNDWRGFMCACALVESSGPGLFYRGTKTSIDDDVTAACFCTLST